MTYIQYRKKPMCPYFRVKLTRNAIDMNLPDTAGQILACHA